MTNYRRDSRSEEEFAKDISECTKLERVLMQKYVDTLNSRIKDENVYTFVDNGVDNSGKLLPDNEVNCDADFLLKRSGKPDRKVDIKHGKQWFSQIHFKVNHLENAVRDDVCIVCFNGVETANPKFIILRPIDIQALLDTGYRCKFWNKPVIRIYTAQQTWQDVI